MGNESHGPWRVNGYVRAAKKGRGKLILSSPLNPPEWRRAINQQVC